MRAALALTYAPFIVSTAIVLALLRRRRRRGRSHREKHLQRLLVWKSFHTSPPLGEPTQANLCRTIETSFPMTILTGAELKALMGLRMNWGRLYWTEIVRLQNEDDSRHGADCGADLAHGPANRNEKGVISVLHKMSTHAEPVDAGVSRLTHPNNDRWTSAHSQLTANVLRLPK